MSSPFDLTAGYVGVSKPTTLSCCIYSVWLFFFFPKGMHLQHVKVPGLGVKSELQLLTYTTATPDPSHFCQPTLQSMATPNP